jgi:WD40 repeat protein
MLALTSLAFSGGPMFWEISRQEDVLKGDARGVSIAENGAIMLAPAYTLVYDTKEAYIWSSASDTAGNIYLGTGHEGRIFKVDASGAGKLLYDAGELDVYAMTTDPQGNLYAATSPEGKIYKITQDGRASGFYDPPDKYIWSLAFDPATGTLYAGTGDKGVIYRIDPQGKAAVLADTNENNIISLISDRGSLIAGSDPGGLVLRISQDGKVFALFDSPMQEIHSLALSQDGSVMALGVNAQQRQSAGVSSTTSLSSEGVITLSTDDQEQATVISASDTQRGRSRADNARGALFRIRADGSSEIVWSASDSIGFALRLLADGQAMVGTNNKGRIYSVSSSRAQTLLIQSPEDQTSTFLTAGDTVYATSSNLGRLYRLGRESVSEGTYTSPVRDTRFAGQWGAINWRGAGTVEIQTRTGNTETPDSTWSEWSAPYRNSSGDQISSPRARFIQWRATLRSASRGKDKSSLQSVVIAYLPRNQSPEIASLNVFPAGVAMQETPLAVDPSIASSGLDPQMFGVISNVPPRRYYQKGARTLVWQAADANDDSLVYRIFYRAVDAEQWHLLAEGITQSYYTIDASRLPDGAYIFKVEASDSPSNPQDMALVGEEMTEAVEIDNTPPAIRVLGPSVTGSMAEVTFEVADATGRVIRGEYSVDGGPWTLVFPVDGIADSSRESFRVRVNLNSAGAHVIAFRCADSSLNVGTSKAQAVRQ